MDKTKSRDEQIEEMVAVVTAVSDQVFAGSLTLRLLKKSAEAALAVPGVMPLALGWLIGVYSTYEKLFAGLSLFTNERTISAMRQNFAAQVQDNKLNLEEWKRTHDLDLVRERSLRRSAERVVDMMQSVE